MNWKKKYQDWTPRVGDTVRVKDTKKLRNEWSGHECDIGKTLEILEGDIGSNGLIFPDHNKLCVNFTKDMLELVGRK